MSIHRLTDNTTGCSALDLSSYLLVMCIIINITPTLHKHNIKIRLYDFNA